VGIFFADDYFSTPSSPESGSVPVMASAGQSGVADYMTAQPTANPTLRGVVTNTPHAPSTHASADPNLGLASSGWEFSRDLARAQRLMVISNSLGLSQRYIAGMERSLRTGPVPIVVYLNPIIVGRGIYGETQVIVRPVLTAPNGAQPVNYSF